MRGLLGLHGVYGRSCYSVQVTRLLLGLVWLFCLFCVLCGVLWGAWVGEWRGSGVTKGFAAVRVKLCGLQKALGGVRLFHGRLFAGSEFQCDSCSACNSHIAVTERNEEVGS